MPKSFLFFIYLLTSVFSQHISCYDILEKINKKDTWEIFCNVHVELHCDLKVFHSVSIQGAQHNALKRWCKKEPEFR